MPSIFYYVVRQSSGTAQERLVPMVPMDQLPDWLEIVGVPRELPAEHAAKMTALLDLGRGDEASDGTFQVRLRAGMGNAGEAADEVANKITEEEVTGKVTGKVTEETTPEAREQKKTANETGPCQQTTDTTASAPPDDAASAATTTVISAVPPAMPSAVPDDAPDDDDKPCAKEAPALRTANRTTTTTTAATPDKPTTTSPTKKAPARARSSNPSKAADVLPCKYWCHHGRCGFADRCRFAHVMPLTRASLRAVDLDELPPWYIAKKQKVPPADPRTEPLPWKTSDNMNMNTTVRPNAAPSSSHSTPARARTRNSTTRATASSSTRKPGREVKHPSPAAAVEDLIDLS